MSASARPRRPPRWWLGALAWALCGLTFLGLVATVWLDQLLHQAGRPELVWFGTGSAPSTGATVIAATAGALVASRQPGHPVGWLLLAMGLSGRGGRGRGVRAGVGRGPDAAVPGVPGRRRPIGVPALAEPPLDTVVPLAGLVVLLALVAGAWSLPGRFRRARGSERQQLRWLAWGEDPPAGQGVTAAA